MYLCQISKFIRRSQNLVKILNVLDAMDRVTFFADKMKVKVSIDSFKLVYFLLTFSFLKDSVVWYLQIKTDMSVSMDFGLDFVNPDEEEEYLDKDEEVDGEKSNKCSQCDYASSQVGHLRRHLKTHSGEKPNKCNQCDFASTEAGNLRRHLKTHTGEKSNKCNQCDYASSRVGDLRKHLKTHSGEKSNRCNQCDYAFFQAGDLREHLKTHSG